MGPPAVGEQLAVEYMDDQVELLQQLQLRLHPHLPHILQSIKCYNIRPRVEDDNTFQAFNIFLSVLVIFLEQCHQRSGYYL